MIKKVLGLSVLLAFWGLSANAQIATPYLDRNMKSLSPAATGWRAGSSAGLQAISAKGDVERTSSGTTIKSGEIEIGGSIPGVVVALKGESVGLEIYLSSEAKKKITQVFQASPLVPIDTDLEFEQTLAETRLNLAYIVAESISIGLGYRKNEQKTVVDLLGFTGSVNPSTGSPIIYASRTEASNETEAETGTMLSASYNIAEIFYLAAGMESVTLKTSSDTGADYVDNTWSNTVMGLGMMTGEPGDTQFRVEYSMIQSKESEKDDAGGKIAHIHPKTTIANAALEVAFGEIFLSYLNETTKEDFSSDSKDDSKVVVTTMGLGWMPEEGISVSAYMVNIENKETSSDGLEMKITPKGYRLNVG